MLNMVMLRLSMPPAIAGSLMMWHSGSSQLTNLILIDLAQSHSDVGCVFKEERFHSSFENIISHELQFQHDYMIQFNLRRHNDYVAMSLTICSIELRRTACSLTSEMSHHTQLITRRARRCRRRCGR